MDPLDQVRAFLDRRTAVTFIASCDLRGLPEVGLLVAAQVTPDGHVAGGEEADVGGRTFRNLRQNARSTLLVLDPVMDPRARDGVRVDVEFLGAQEDGPDLDHLTRWLGAFAPGRRIARRLVFRVLDVSPYRPRAESPILT
jgi:hypothetical protein